MANPRLLAKAGYVALAALDSTLATRSSAAARRTRYLTKPLLMPALATATHLATEGRQDPLVRGTLAAQACSWGGDIALLGRSRPAFLAGVGSFFAAHLAYISAFTTERDPGAALTDPGPKAAATAWLVCAPVMAVAAGRKDASLRVPVAAYGSILAGMFATSTTLRRTIPATARRQVVVGTSLFLLSDTLLGLQEFFRDEPSPVLEGAVMATYAAGQLLIASGVAATA